MGIQLQVSNYKNVQIGHPHDCALIPDKLKRQAENQSNTFCIDTIKAGVHMNSWEAGWPHGYCAQLQSEHSGFELWLGTFYCVLGQDTLLSVPLSTQEYK